MKKKNEKEKNKKQKNKKKKMKKKEKKMKKKIAASFKAQRQVDLVMYRGCQIWFGNVQSIPEQFRKYLIGNV